MTALQTWDRDRMSRGYSSVVELQPSKLIARVRSPLPAPTGIHAHIAQQVEHFLGKEEAIGSSPIVSTKPPLSSAPRNTS